MDRHTASDPPWAQDENLEGALVSNCGNRPKLLAIGIAPLGIISIGVVPMGVVSVGVVPMGVLSVGAVAMGVVNLAVVGMGVLVAGVNVMGVWWAGMEGMGPYRLGGAASTHLHHHQQPAGNPASDPAANRFAYPSREEALSQARRLGCEGAHRMGSLWMPCNHHAEP
jgi:hypothetical protein